MPEDTNNSNNSDSHSNMSSNVQEELKSLKKDLKFVRKVLIAEFKGKYNKEIEEDIKGDLKFNELQKPNSFFKSYFLASIIFSSAILISFSIFAVNSTVGTKIMKNLGFVPNAKTNTGSADNANLKAALPPEEEGPKYYDVSIDDDPVLGRDDAPVTIIEFSDFDCPWCKTFYDQNFVKLKADYIDTGKVKFVYRDLPIVQLHPDAVIKHLGANCAIDQGGNEAYYKYHDELFIRSKSNSGGPALSKADIMQIATDLGFNQTTFKDCVDSEKYLDEINKDKSDAVSVDAFGTPAFYIGKSTSNNIINGQQLSGYLPYAQFKTLIDQYL